MWCIELEEYSAAQVDHYFCAMALLEADYPDVTFIYFTGNAQAEGATGNGTVDINDKTNGWSLNAGIGGCFNGDFNLDGHVGNVDKNGSWETNLDAGSEIPE